MTEKEKMDSLGVNRENLGFELAKWRIRQGLTQAQLAERWGMSRYSILRAEKGKSVGWRFVYGIAARLARELRTETGVDDITF